MKTLADTIPHVMRRMINIKALYKEYDLKPAKWVPFLENMLEDTSLNGSGEHVLIMAIHALLLEEEL